MINYFRNIKNADFWLLSIFFLVSLLNFVFKKYDYGAEFPMVILLCLLLPVFYYFNRNKKKEMSGLDTLFLMIFSVCVIISFVFSQTRNVGLSEVMAFLSAVSIYLFFAHRRLDWKDKFLKVIFWGLYFSVVIGFVTYFLLDPQRMSGPFFNIFYHSNFWPNAFALFIVMAWPVMLLVIKDKHKLTSVFLFSFVFSALLLSYSRGALIAFSGQIVLLAIIFFRKINLKLLFTVVAIVAMTGVIFISSNYVRSFTYSTISVKERVSFQNNEIMTSGQERIDFWKGAIELIKEKPLFGFGPYSFRYAFNPYQKIFLGSSDHPHNIFLKIGAENGLIALGAFLLFLIYILGLFVGRFRNLSKEDKVFVLMISVAVLGAFAHNLIDYNFNFLATLLLLFVYLAFIRSTLIKKENRECFFQRNFKILLIAVLFLVAVFESCMIVLPRIGVDINRDYSLYQRYSYLNIADSSLKNNDFELALSSLEKQLKLNPIDDKAYYLKGAIFCNEKFANYNLNTCLENLRKAYELNPQNDIRYYLDYLLTMKKNGLGMNDAEFKNIYDKSLDLFHLYFGYVKNNVHFTSYTSNVEAACELAIFLTGYMNLEESRKIITKNDLMLLYAKLLRGKRKAQEL